MAECIVDLLKKKGCLCSPDLKEIQVSTVEPFLNFIDKAFAKRPFVLTKKMYEDFIILESKKNKENELRAIIPSHQSQPLTQAATLQVQAPIEPRTQSCTTTEASTECSDEDEEENVVIRPSKERLQITTEVKIKKNHLLANKKVGIGDFVTYYTDRYNRIRDLLSKHEELRNAVSIGRVSKTDGRQKVEVIGIILEMRKLFNGGLGITLEDPTGVIKAFIKADQQRVIDQLVPDEVIGVVGTYSRESIYIEKIIFPDIPMAPLKRADNEVYAAFISDVHAGSNMFLEKEFTQCIDWLSGKMGSSGQRALAEKIRYLFIIGDLVDGVGVYPGQDKELKIKDIYQQYNEVGKFLARLPEDIRIVALPGNHDALRLSEPQPPFYRDFAKALYDLPNFTAVSNPSLVNIHAVDKFPGFNVLSYHGQSFDHYVANTPSLIEYGYNRADLVQEMFLKKRHLSPTHGATSSYPSPVDTMVIDTVPDIFATGHIHKTKVGRYKNVINLNCGCFQDKTTFQEKVGHDPEPGRVPIVNLQSGEVKLMRFR